MIPLDHVVEKVMFDEVDMFDNFLNNATTISKCS